jgi:hypothetical protein
MVTAKRIVIVIVSGEASNGPSSRAFDFVRRADHETTTGDAVNVWVLSRQTFHQHAKPCNGCLPPLAVP